MTDAKLAKRPEQGAMRRISRYTEEQVELIKNTICKGATDLELDFFLATADRLQLDPLARQIFAVKRWNSDVGAMVMQVQTSIDGFRVVAERSHEYEGQTEPQWCGQDGVWKEVWLAKEPPAAARVGVYRKGMRAPMFAVAHYDEFVQRTKEGAPNRMWKNMPRTMLLKCAESQALRKAFPQDLSGIYTEEEMGQADNEDATGASVHSPRALVGEEFHAAANEQAKRRLEAETEAEGWIPLLEKLRDAKELEMWVRVNGYQYRALHANAQARIRRVLAKTAKRVGVELEDVKRMVLEADEFPVEETDEAVDVEPGANDDADV